MNHDGELANTNYKYRFQAITVNVINIKIGFFSCMVHNLFNIKGPMFQP